MHVIDSFSFLQTFSNQSTLFSSSCKTDMNIDFSFISFRSAFKLLKNDFVFLMHFLFLAMIHWKKSHCNENSTEMFFFIRKSIINLTYEHDLNNETMLFVVCDTKNHEIRVTHFYFLTEEILLCYYEKIDGSSE